MNHQSNHICPLCGEPNECARANNAILETQCWCRDAIINPEAIALAHQAQHIGRCICKSCSSIATTSILGISRPGIKLYSTEYCHLCKEAEAIIHKMGISALPIDIAEDDGLLEKYSMRIPVLRRDDKNAELDWPFDAVTVAQFLI